MLIQPPPAWGQSSKVVDDGWKDGWMDGRTDLFSESLPLFQLLINAGTRMADSLSQWHQLSTINQSVLWYKCSNITLLSCHGDIVKMATQSGPALLFSSLSPSADLNAPQRRSHSTGNILHLDTPGDHNLTH